MASHRALLPPPVGVIPAPHHEEGDEDRQCPERNGKNEEEKGSGFIIVSCYEYHHTYTRILASPVFSFTYDGVNNLLTEVDALGKTTTYAYDERNRLETKTLPDPDSGGSGNPAPQFTYVYDGVGNVTDEGNPYFADNVTHTYDAYGRLTNTSQKGKRGRASQSSFVTNTITLTQGFV